MTQFEVVELFKSIGFDCLEDRMCEEVNDYGYYSRFGNDTNEIQFQNRDDKLKVSIVQYDLKTNSIDITSDLALAIAEQVKVVLEEYKGEIE
jgi:hypothetical protein